METKQNDFAAHVAADEAAQAHAQEIQQTRIGGLGGSDAALVLRIAERGLAGLTERIKAPRPAQSNGAAIVQRGKARKERCGLQF